MGGRWRFSCQKVGQTVGLLGGAKAESHDDDDVHNEQKYAVKRVLGLLDWRLDEVRHYLTDQHRPVFKQFLIPSLSVSRSVSRSRSPPESSLG